MTQQQIVDTLASRVQLIESVGEADGSPRHRARFQVSRANEKNGNGRFYPRHIWERESRKVAEGKVVITGQSRHPNYDIDVLDTFLRFEELAMEGDDLYGTSLVIETSKGRDFIEIAKVAPEIISVSTRGRGTMKKGKDEAGNEVMVIQDDYELEGIDIIFKGYQSFKDGSMLAFEALTPEAAAEQAAPEPEPVAEAEPEPAPEPVAEAAPEPEPLEAIAGAVITTDYDKMFAHYGKALELAAQNVTQLEKRVAFAENERDDAQRELAELKAAFATEQEAHNETKATLARTDAHITELEQQRAARDFLVQEARNRKFYGALIAQLWGCATVEEVKAKLPAAEQTIIAELANLSPAGRAILAGPPENGAPAEPTDKPDNWRDRLVRQPKKP